MLSMASASSVPVGFHYETKYVVLSYLGFSLQEGARQEPTTSTPGVHQPASAPSALSTEELDKIKVQIEEELKKLEEEISAAFPSTGFDMHTSPVFSPVSPETSIEECLTQLADRMCLEIPEYLDKGCQNLLSGSLTFDAFRTESEAIALHTAGWSQVLVPLGLLQRLLLELTRLSNWQIGNLVQLGVSYIEEVYADYIIQQGGWGTVFSLDTEDDDVPGLIAEDSNDIYILTSDTSEQVSPPESLAVSASWHTESLPTSLGPESWQQVAMDPEELKSLDSNGGAEERSENNSSNSDIVHVDKEEIAEVIEEAAVVEQRLEQQQQEAAVEEPDEHEILEVPIPLIASAALTSTEVVEESRPLPAIEVDPPIVDITIKGVLEKEPQEVIEESKEVTPPSEVEKIEAALTPLLSPPKTEEEKPVFLPEGKSILLYGGAAAVAILAVAVGMVMALRKK